MTYNVFGGTLSLAQSVAYPVSYCYVVFVGRCCQRCF